MSSVAIVYQEILYLTPGWWYTYPSAKFEFVSWDCDIPKMWKNLNYVLMFKVTIATDSWGKKIPDLKAA